MLLIQILGSPIAFYTFKSIFTYPEITDDNQQDNAHVQHLAQHAGLSTIYHCYYNLQLTSFHRYRIVLSMTVLLACITYTRYTKITTMLILVNS